MGRKRRGEQAKIYLSAFYFDNRAPSGNAMSPNSFVSAPVIAPEASVLGVLSARAKTEVFSPVIETIAVDVINHLPGHRAQYHSMEMNPFVARIFAANNIELPAVLHHGPPVFTNKLKIRLINQHFDRTINEKAKTHASPKKSRRAVRRRQDRRRKLAQGGAGEDGERNAEGLRIHWLSDPRKSPAMSPETWT